MKLVELNLQDSIDSKPYALFTTVSVSVFLSPNEKVLKSCKVVLQRLQMTDHTASLQPIKCSVCECVAYVHCLCSALHSLSLIHSFPLMLLVFSYRSSWVGIEYRKKMWISAHFSNGIFIPGVDRLNFNSVLQRAIIKWDSLLHVIMLTMAINRYKHWYE